MCTNRSGVKSLLNVILSLLNVHDAATCWLRICHLSENREHVATLFKKGRPVDAGASLADAFRSNETKSFQALADVALPFNMEDVSAGCFQTTEDECPVCLEQKSLFETQTERRHYV